MKKFYIVFLLIFAVQSFVHAQCLEVVPFTEDFEAATAVPQNTCWSEAGTTYTGSATAFGLYVGSQKSMRVDFGGGQGDLMMLTTTTFDFSGEVAGELTFDWQSYDNPDNENSAHYAGDYFKVKLSVDGGVTFPTVVWERNSVAGGLQGGNCTSTSWPNGSTWSNEAIALPGVGGENDIVLLFEFLSDPSGWSSADIFIDNITVSGATLNNVDPAAAATNLAPYYLVDDVVSPTVDVLNNGDGDVTVDVTLVINDGTSDVVNETVSSAAIASDATGTVTFSDWTAVAGNYTYTATVVDPGSDSDLTNNEITGTFDVFATNPCLNTLPFSEDFETATVVPQNYCWSDEGTVFSGTGSAFAIYSGSGKSMRVDYDMNGKGDIYYLKTPTFDFTTEDGGELIFDWQTHSGGHYAGDYFKIKLSTDGGLTFPTTIWERTGAFQGGTCSNTSWPNGDWESTGSIELPGVAGENDVVLLFELLHDPTGWSYSDVFIDNIEVNAVAAVNDAEVSATNIATTYEAGTVVSPTVDVTNNGNVEMTVDVTLVMNDGTSNVVDETVSAVVVAVGATETVTFTDWTSVEGSYTYTATASDPGGDIDLTNNELTGTFDATTVNVDAEVTATNIATTYVAGDVVSPTVDVINNGDNEMTVDVTLVLNDGTSDVVNETVSAVVVAVGATEVVSFTDWTSVAGNYTFDATVSDPGGDTNLANNELTGSFEVTVPNIDAELSGINIEAEYLAGDVISPIADVVNNGDYDMTVNVTLVINDGTSDVVNETISDLVYTPGATDIVTFTDWTTVAGNYTFTATVSDPGGDIDLTNNEITGAFEVLDPSTCIETLPYLEDFESASSVPPTACWSDEGTIYTGDPAFEPWDIYFGSSKSAYAEYWKGAPGDTYMLKTPTFDFTNEVAGELTFDWQSRGDAHSPGDYFKIKLSTDGGATFPTTVWYKNGDNMQGGTCSINTWPNGDWESSGALSLPGVAGENDVVLLFELYEDPAGSSAGRVFIDNISVYGVTVDNVDAVASSTNLLTYYVVDEVVSPTVDVINNGDSDMTVDVTLVINDGTSDVVNETISDVTVTTGATETVSFTNWTAVTANYTYTATVSDPGGDTNLDNNEIAGVFEVFDIDPCVYTLPYFEDFEAADTVPSDACWSTEGTSFTGVAGYSPWDIYFGMNKSAFAEFWQGAPDDIFMLTTPTFDFSSEGEGTLTFDWQSNGASHSAGDYFKVKVSTDGGATYSTVWFRNGDNMQGGTCSANTWPNGDWESSGDIVLPGVAGIANVKILFEMYEDPVGYSSGRVFIDNISVTGGGIVVDAEVSATNIGTTYNEDDVISPTVDATNNGDNEMTVEVTLVISDGTSNVIDETVSSLVVAAGATETVVFTDWTAVPGSYTYTATVSDPGEDINLDNNELTGVFDVEPIGLGNINNGVVNIYPNPSEGVFNLNGSSALSFVVFDVAGQIIESGNISGDKTVEIHNAGIYFFRFSNGVVEKVIVK